MEGFLPGGRGAAGRGGVGGSWEGRGGGCRRVTRIVVGLVVVGGDGSCRPSRTSSRGPPRHRHPPPPPPPPAPPPTHPNPDADARLGLGPATGRAQEAGARHPRNDGGLLPEPGRACTGPARRLFEAERTRARFKFVAIQVGRAGQPHRGGRGHRKFRVTIPANLEREPTRSRWMQCSLRWRGRMGRNAAIRAAASESPSDC